MACMFSAVRALVPGRYRSLFADRTFRRLMPVFALSDLGDGMTVVAVAWMALALGPEGGQGALIGIAVAAYILPGALGALVLGRWLRRLPAQRLLIIDSGLRAGLLGAIPLAHVAGTLTPAVYVGLLGASSLLHAWGKAGKHALFAPLLGDDQRLAANSVLSTSLWSATIAGPALAGLLVGVISPAWIIGLDAATFAVLALQTGRTSLPAASPAGSRRHPARAQHPAPAAGPPRPARRDLAVQPRLRPRRGRPPPVRHRRPPCRPGTARSVLGCLRDRRRHRRARPGRGETTPPLAGHARDHRGPRHRHAALRRSPTPRSPP